jgi:hypothetical protein
MWLSPIRRGQVVLMPLGIHGAKAGMSELVEGINFDLLVERGDGIVVLALLPVGASQGVVGVFVVGLISICFLRAAMASSFCRSAHVGQG